MFAETEDSYIVSECPSVLELVDEYPTLFYNQTWYRDEAFAKKRAPFTYKFAKELVGNFPDLNDCPPAAAVLYLNVEYYLHTGGFLWPENYVWCRDTDSNGDQVYVGGSRRNKMNKIEIHRHIKIRPYFKYAVVS